MGLLLFAVSSASGQRVPTWEEWPPDESALMQQAMLLGMRLVLESELELDGLDVRWGESPRTLRKRLDGVVGQVMTWRGERTLSGFNGFSDQVEWLLEDVEELDERDVARGRMDRSVEERMYVLVQSRMSELELQLAMELGIFERSGLWERIMAAAGWDLPVDPGIGNAMEALEIPLSRETQRILSAEDDSFWPVVKERTEVAPTWVGQLAAMLGGANGVHSVSNSSLPLEELHLPESFDVPFAAGSAVLDLNARMQLAEVRDLMGRYPELRVVCTGHADANGPRRSNEELSKVRAEAVRAMLLESGVDPARVLMNYFGEERAGWVPEDDRRVEVRFHWDAR